MNDPLELPLRDIHLPDPASWWPLAYGWWLLLAALIIVVLAIVFIYRRNRQMRLSAISRARQELARITSEYQRNHDPLLLSRELSILLRRLCISLFPRTEVASLTGSDWLAFLDKYIQGAPFSRGQGRMLVDAPYRQSLDAEEVHVLVQQCREWIDAVSRSRGKLA